MAMTWFSALLSHRNTPSANTSSGFTACSNTSGSSSGSWRHLVCRSSSPSAFTTGSFIFHPRRSCSCTSSISRLNSNSANDRYNYASPRTATRVPSDPDFASFRDSIAERPCPGNSIARPGGPASAQGNCADKGVPKWSFGTRAARGSPYHPRKGTLRAAIESLRRRCNGQLGEIGLAGFEPAASSSRTKRSTKLSHSP